MNHFGLKSVQNSASTMDDEEMGKNYLVDLFGDYPVGRVSDEYQVKGVQSGSKMEEGTSISVTFCALGGKIVQNVAFLMDDGRSFGLNHIELSMEFFKDDYGMIVLKIFNDSGKRLDAKDSGCGSTVVEEGCSTIKFYVEKPAEGCAELHGIWVSGFTLRFPVKWIA
jgi:hypothetical protein